MLSVRHARRDLLVRAIWRGLQRGLSFAGLGCHALCVGAFCAALHACACLVVSRGKGALHRFVSLLVLLWEPSAFMWAVLWTDLLLNVSSVRAL